jgi:multicomponent K+:H+ antiporter subunit G
MAAYLVELLIAALIVMGGFFLLVGSFGLVKLPEIMTRLHAPTKATTLGVGSVLIASMLYFLVQDGNPTIHELVITLFLFLTAPITANFLAKAHLHQHKAERELPASGRPTGWATFDPPPAERERSAAKASGPAGDPA